MRPVILIAFLLLAQCGNPSVGKSGGESGNAVTVKTGADCEKLCGKFEACDSATDESDCIEDCEGDTLLSDALWESYESCTNEASCNELETEELQHCIERNLPDSPSEQGQEFCDEYAARANECSDTADENDIRASCESGFGVLFGDTFIAGLDHCLEESCDQLSQCLFEEFELAKLPEEAVNSDVLAVIVKATTEQGTADVSNVCDEAADVAEDDCGLEPGEPTPSEECQGDTEAGARCVVDHSDSFCEFVDDPTVMNAYTDCVNRI